jgi:D-amino-acid dehydrogenase
LHNTEITGFDYSGGKINSVTTSEGEEIKADHFVVCAANFSGPLLKKVGIKIPLIPLKGYSLYFKD